MCVSAYYWVLFGRNYGSYWFVDSGITASGSVRHTFDGRQCYRSMRLHKGFDALTIFLNMDLALHLRMKHGDSVAEYFNKESKGTTGPYWSGYISIYIYHNAVNKWIVTSYIHSKLRMIRRENRRLHTSSKHKETAISHKRMHQKLVENLKSESKDYSVNAFEDSSAICISTVKKWIFPCFRVYSKLQS